MKAFTYSQSLLKKDKENSFTVVHLQSDTGMKCFETEGDADNHAAELNKKAKALGVEARYEVRPTSDGQAIDKDGNKVL